MVEAANTTDRPPPGRWQFTLQGLFLLSFSLAVGLSIWKTEQDWYVGALAAVSFWVVFGLAAQVRDMWRAFLLDSHATTDEQWGWRFALAWRLAVCFLIVVSFVFRILFRFQVLAIDTRDDFVGVSSLEIWDAVLLTSLIAAIAGSLGLGHRRLQRPWSWAVYVFRGVTVGALFLMIMEERQILPCLVHVSVVAMLSAQSLQFEPDVVFAASRIRIAQFFDITTAGAISLLVSCILVWQLSVWWRSAGRRRLYLGALLAASLTVMLLLTARIIVVEIPAISPIMAANIPLPTPSQLAAAVVLVAMLATAVARRWSELPCVGSVRTISPWRRDEWRYYHEGRVLILFLGGIALAECVVLGQQLITFFHGWTYDRYVIGCLLWSPIECLSLVLVLLAAHVAIFGRSKRSGGIATEQPRLTPGLFLVVWFSAFMIVACSAPILSAWHFAAFLRAGCFPK